MYKFFTTLVAFRSKFRECSGLVTEMLFTKSPNGKTRSVVGDTTLIKTSATLLHCAMPVELASMSCWLETLKPWEHGYESGFTRFRLALRPLSFE